MQTTRLLAQLLVPAVSLLVAGQASAQATDLFISEYVDGVTTNNRAVELFNLTGLPIDLAAGGYKIRVYQNGSATPNLTIALTGTVQPAEAFVLIDANSPNPTIQAAADQSFAGLGWSGDDAIELVKGAGNTPLDVIGQIGFDPGTEWGAGDASTADNTIRRKVRIVAGDADGGDAFVPADEWDGFPNGTFDGLGTHAVHVVMINEVDSDTPGATDTAEFIELYDGGQGNIPLDGITIVLFDGATDTSYLSVDLDGESTDANGYYVVGNASVVSGSAANNVHTLADNSLQNGADAIALYLADGSAFPNGTAVTTSNLVDAIVYDTSDADDPGLLVLLNAGQQQVNEAGGGSVTTESLQRCPNGSGGLRNTSSFAPSAPTDMAASTYTATVTSATATPASICPGSSSQLSGTVGSDETIAWYTGSCGETLVGTGNPLSVSPATTTTYFGRAKHVTSGCEAATCVTVTVTINTTDTDGDGTINCLDGCPNDPNKIAPGVFGCGVSENAGVIVINEIDAKTPDLFLIATDAFEFVELFAPPNTPLDGMVLVFFDGSTDTSYKALDLDGKKTDANGYFVAGSSSAIYDMPTVNSIEFPYTTLQDGADAVALYIGSASNFPNGTAITTTNLRDAVVYDTDDTDDAGLLALLNPGQPQVNEAGGGPVTTKSLQRCPNGGGGQRNTTSFAPSAPTALAANSYAATVTAPTATPASICQGSSSQLAGTVAGSEETIAWYTGSCGETFVGTGNTLSVSPATTTTYFGRAKHVPSGCEAATCVSVTVTINTTDTDGDGTINCLDGCPNDPNKTEPGVFGCGVSENAGVIVINEIDVDSNAGSDIAEFVELFAPANTPLNGMVLVFFDGSTDTSYQALDLDGKKTNANGYFIAGTSLATFGVPTANSITFSSDTLQDGADAVALYIGSASNFPNGTAITTTNLRDAVVYDGGQADDAELLALLNPDQPQVNEAGGGSVTTKSLQRCPNGGGDQRNTVTFAPSASTKMAANSYAATVTAPTATPSSICQGSSSQLAGTVAGSEETIAWYTGSCGETLVGTGSPLSVSPATTTTYFGRAQHVGSGCEGTACVSVTVSVTPATLWFQDLDGDGVGSFVTIVSCTQPSGYVAIPGDICPNDPGKTNPGICGCGTPDTDSDGDGTVNCQDLCPSDPLKTSPGACGCGVLDADSDGDGLPDCLDECPTDPLKIEPGICGCGVADTDTDGDGTADCLDGCPTDPLKTEAGICGCGVPDVDADGDGAFDCVDLCPSDPLKTAPGECGCGVPDEDSDSDGVLDCNDECPGYPDTVDCNLNGIPDGCDIANETSEDANRNGVPDECECVGDIDSNGVVDGADLATLLGNWGGSGAGDLDSSGVVDGADLATLLGAWGPC